MSSKNIINFVQFASNSALNRVCELERGKGWSELYSRYRSIARYRDLRNGLLSFVYYTFFGVILENIKRWRFDTFVTATPPAGYCDVTLPHLFSLGRHLTLSYSNIELFFSVYLELMNKFDPLFAPVYFFVPPVFLPTTYLPILADRLESMVSIISLPIRAILFYKLVHFSYLPYFFMGSNMFLNRRFYQ